MSKFCIFAALFLSALFASAPLCAQMPFNTDDTAVTDPYTLHIESFDEVDALQSAQYPDVRQNTANLKINVGLPLGLEIDLDAPYLTIDRGSGAHSSRGIGDTDMGIKWNVQEASADTHRPALAVSFYAEFPTGNTQQQLGSGLIDYWLNLIAQVRVTERTRLNVNLGILFAGNTSTGVVGIETTHGQVYTGGLSMLHDVSTKLTLGAEVYGGVSDNPGLNRTQLQTMLGGQYTIREGITVCLGLIAGTYAGSPRIGDQIGLEMDFPNTFGSSNAKSVGPLLRRLPFTGQNLDSPGRSFQ